MPTVIRPALLTLHMDDEGHAPDLCLGGEAGKAVTPVAFFLCRPAMGHAQLHTIAQVEPRKSSRGGRI